MSKDMLSDENDKMAAKVRKEEQQKEEAKIVKAAESRKIAVDRKTTLNKEQHKEEE